MQTADFTIADVLAWARTKPADERYAYYDTENCALCQFLRETGRCASPTVGGDFWTNADAFKFGEHPLPPPLAEGLVGGQTFGDLVKRLETLCPETPVTPSTWLQIDAYLTDIEDVARELVVS